MRTSRSNLSSQMLPAGPADAAAPEAVAAHPAGDDRIAGRLPRRASPDARTRVSPADLNARVAAAATDRAHAAATDASASGPRGPVPVRTLIGGARLDQLRRTLLATPPEARQAVFREMAALQSQAGNLRLDHCMASDGSLTATGKQRLRVLESQDRGRRSMTADEIRAAQTLLRNHAASPQGATEAGRAEFFLRVCEHLRSHAVRPGKVLDVRPGDESELRVKPFFTEAGDSTRAGRNLKLMNKWGSSRPTQENVFSQHPFHFQSPPARQENAPRRAPSWDAALPDEAQADEPPPPYPGPPEGSPADDGPPLHPASSGRR